MIFRMAQQKHIRVLLGRNMRITIPVAGSPSELDVQGQVLSIQPADEEMGEYKISLVFDQELEQEELQTVLG
jgi:hypothetical protein